MERLSRKPRTYTFEVIVVFVLIGIVMLAASYIIDCCKLRKVTDELYGRRINPNMPWVELYSKEDRSNPIGRLSYIGKWYPDGTIGIKVREDIAQGLTTAFPEIVAEYNGKIEREKRFKEIYSSGD